MLYKRFITTTNASHKNCFICKKKHSVKNRLKKLDPTIILKVLKKKKIYIRKDSRCCPGHFFKDGTFKYDELKNIAIIKNKSDDQLKSFLKTIKKNNIFEEFLHIEKLENEHCIKITGWSKTEFIRFSNFITSIYDTKSRTKEQLIALYRYWLRKGIDQTTLAFLFGNGTTQNQISHYLSQIREAIYKDFVPYFLGSRREKQFFLKHNKIITKELHEIDNETIIIVVDGTYCRVEKSANNNFQHSCWSGQKKDLLIKPFLICCDDGYIIDCYGAFEAYENDASILSIILEKDKDLKNLLSPGKTVVFLDRGNFLITKE